MGLVIFLWGSLSSGVAREPTLAERFQAQKAIEQVYWSHRTWPQESTRPKPPLSAVQPDEAIRARVEDSLKKSAAVGVWWHKAIAAAQLQAEMDRMARQSRDPRMLRELFEALGNDPLIIAETLARPALADRLVRNWYATDDRFHGALRVQARAARDLCASVSCMKSMGGTYSEMRAMLDTDGGAGGAGGAGGKEGLDDAALHLDGDEWKSFTRRLAAQVGGTQAAVRIGVPGDVEETADAFHVTAILSRSDTQIVTATTTWPKRTFDAWWDSQRGALPARIDADPAAAFTIPALALTGCTNDTWAPTRQDVPDPRHNHSAVWTGAEMIVWGGEANPAIKSGGRYNPATDTWQPTSLGTNVPAGRYGHTGIWTGTEMIVWGGFPYAGPAYNTGGRYDPVTDTWLPTSTGAGVPSARAYHTAVWTGSEMIVWGGSADGRFSNTGARYNPVTDTWAPTSLGADVPSIRYHHTAVWTGAEMIVWGGQGSGSTYLNTGGRYDPASNTWTPTSTSANVPAARAYHTAVWTGTRMIIWGGNVSAVFPNTSETNTGAVYDPSMDTWAATSVGSSLPLGRSQHTAVWTGSEMIVWGGQYYQYTNPSGQYFPSAGGRYDPTSDQWMPTSTGPNVPLERFYHTALWTGSTMLVWGGAGPVSLGLNSVNTGGRYDPLSDSWVPTSTGGSVPGARASHASVWTGTEMIVWGGLDVSYVGTRTGGRYLPATDSWTPTSVGASLPSARATPAVWTGLEMIAWGGGAGSMNTGDRYNPSTDTWASTSTTGAPSIRSGFAVLWTGKEMIVWGGRANGGSNPPYLTTGGRYDPATDQWSSMSATNAPSGRTTMQPVWTGTEMIVWGGYTYNGTSFVGVNTGGRYNPSTDQWASTSTGTNVPAARYGHASVWTGTEMLVWGGSPGGSTEVYFNSGGRYDPLTNQWSSTSTGGNVPQARNGHTGVWTGREMIVWGGHAHLQNLGTGGRYDPVANAWLPMSQGAYQPEARQLHTAVWTGTNVIVWGGEAGVQTSSGALYCACPNGTLVHRDLDGDGHGNPAVSLPSCDGSIPTGYVADATDCNDANAAVHPGAVEVCNDLDDDCDGATDTGDLCSDGDSCTNNACMGGVCAFTPVVVPEVNDTVTVIKTPAGATIGWTDTPGPFNLYRGTANGAPWTYNAVCFASGASNPATDASVPSAGGAIYYLLSRVGACGESVLGRGSAGTPIPNGSPCP